MPHYPTVAYSAQYECDVVTRDGSTIHLRPLRPDDAAGLRALYERLSVTSIYFRFHAPVADCSSEVARLLRCYYEKEFVLLAEAGGRLSGMAVLDCGLRTVDTRVRVGSAERPASTRCVSY